MDNIEIITNKKYLIISLPGNNTKMLSINKSHITECEIVRSNNGSDERYLKISLVTGKEIKFLKSQMSLETMTKIMTEIVDDSDLC